MGCDDSRRPFRDQLRIGAGGWVLRIPSRRDSFPEITTTKGLKKVLFHSIHNTPLGVYPGLFNSPSRDLSRLSDDDQRLGDGC